MSLVVISTSSADRSFAEDEAIRLSPDALFLLPAGRRGPMASNLLHWTESNTLPELNAHLGRDPIYPYESLRSASEALVIHGELHEVIEGHLLLALLLSQGELPYSVQIEHTPTLRFFDDGQRAMLTRYLASAREVIFYSERNRRDLERLLASTIPNFRIAPLPTLAPSAKSNRALCCPLPLQVVRNGQDILLKALSEFSGWTLTLIDEGPDREYVRELVKQLGLAKEVSFSASQDLERVIAGSDYTVLPTRYDTGTYEVMLSLRSGTPVIATDLGARNILVKPPGAVFPGANVKLLVNALRPILDEGRDTTRSAKTPKVSVIIPCYNYGHHLRACVGSVLAQTFQDFEMIVINDGSTDNSAEVADSLASEYGIRVIHQENSGQPAIVRNRGIRESRGEFIICIDADDIIAPNMLARFVEVLEREPAVDIAYGEGIFFDTAGKVWRQTTGEFELNKLKEANQLFYCAMYRRRVFDVVGGYNLNVRGYEDWDFWIGAAKHGFRAIKVPDALLYYRVAETGLFHNALERDKELRRNIAKNHPSIF
jgi:GT2 family glycosyltransferase